MTRVYTPPRGRHCHECPKCGTVWEHNNSIAEEPEEIKGAAHNCPCCGTEEGFLYWGGKAPEFHDHHIEKAHEDQRTN